MEEHAANAGQELNLRLLADGWVKFKGKTYFEAKSVHVADGHYKLVDFNSGRLLAIFDGDKVGLKQLGGEGASGFKVITAEGTTTNNYTKSDEPVMFFVNEGQEMQVVQPDGEGAKCIVVRNSDSDNGVSYSWENISDMV